MIAELNEANKDLKEGKIDVKSAKVISNNYATIVRHLSNQVRYVGLKAEHGDKVPTMVVFEALSVLK